MILPFLPNWLTWYLLYATKHFPLDMSDFPKLFSTSRVARIEEMDRIERKEDSKHVIVAKGGYFYCFDVVIQHKDGDIKLIDHQTIREIVEIICATPAKSSLMQHVDAFTSLKRDEWEEVRQSLIEYSEINKNTIELLNSALVTVCIDENQSENEQKKPAHQHK